MSRRRSLLQACVTVRTRRRIINQWTFSTMNVYVPLFVSCNNDPLDVTGDARRQFQRSLFRPSLSPVLNMQFIHLPSVCINQRRMLCWTSVQGGATAFPARHPRMRL